MGEKQERDWLPQLPTFLIPSNVPRSEEQEHGPLGPLATGTFSRSGVEMTYQESSTAIKYEGAQTICFSSASMNGKS